MEVLIENVLETLARIPNEKESECAVYVSMNESTKDYYIGATINKPLRKKVHLRNLNKGNHINSNFQNSFNKDPNFTWVEVGVPNRQCAFEAEKFLIEKFRDDPRCLNINKAVNITPEQVAKFKESIAKYNLSLSQEYKAQKALAISNTLKSYYENNPNPRLGVEVTNETKELMSKVHTERWKDPELREEYSKIFSGENNPFFGKTHTEENKQKQSLLSKSLWEDDSFIKKQSDDAKLRWKNPDFRENQVTTQIKTWSNPDLKHKVSVLQKEKMKDLTRRENLSNKQILRMQNPEAVELSRQGAIKQWEDPEIRAKLCRSISVDGEIYESAMEASRTLNISYNTIRSRAISNTFPGYFFNN